MNRFRKNSKAETERNAGLFAVLDPYKGIVIVLIAMALAGSAVNLLIPKIIARGIDAFTAGQFRRRSSSPRGIRIVYGVHLYKSLFEFGFRSLTQDNFYGN